MNYQTTWYLGPDNIPNRFIKRCMSAISQPIACLLKCVVNRMNDKGWSLCEILFYSWMHLSEINIWGVWMNDANWVRLAHTKLVAPCPMIYFTKIIKPSTVKAHWMPKLIERMNKLTKDIFVLNRQHCEVISNF